MPDETRKFYKRKLSGSTNPPMQFVECSEQEYRDWEARRKSDPYYATSHAGEYRISYDLDLDEFQDEVAAPLEGTPHITHGDVRKCIEGDHTECDFHEWADKNQLPGKFSRTRAIALEAYKAGAAAVSKNSREELGRVRKLFHNLTPGGSEFVNDPDYCAEYLREHLNIQHELVINSIKRAKAAEARISELEARLAVKITTGTESHWRGRDEIRSKP